MVYDLTRESLRWRLALGGVADLRHQVGWNPRFHDRLTERVRNVQQNCLLLFERYAQAYFRPGLSVLEIGSLEFPSPYQQHLGAPSDAWDTLNITADPRLTYSGVPPYDYPIADNKYDIVFSSQVMEHVPRIWVWIKELARICKVGGHVITISPLSYPFHGPPDCWRAFPDGMTALYEEGGLGVLLSRCESVEGERFRRVLPGRGLDVQPAYRRWMFKLLGPLGFPVICGYDTITVGRKAGLSAAPPPR
jgi:SAM-dependent methyltransferase